MKVSFLEALWVNSPFRTIQKRRDFRLLRRLGAFRPAGLVLEVGCGSGVGVDLIRRTFHPERVVAVDLDPAMVRLANRRHRGEREHVTVRTADLEELPFPDSGMDAVFEFGIVHHLPDWRAGVAEIARVLKPGGLFYFEEIYPDLYANTVTRALLEHPRHDRFEGAQFRAELDHRGLQLLPGYHESRWRILGVAEKVTA